jgi:hypothetical protein
MLAPALSLLFAPVRDISLDAPTIGFPLEPLSMSHPVISEFDVIFAGGE